MSRILYCPACGKPAEQFVEGYCASCHGERQNALDEHNAQFDWWRALTERERCVWIRNAMEMGQ